MTPEEIKALWPSVERELQAGDILLFHDRESWISRNIRKSDKSYWNHTGLVFMPKDVLPVGGPLIVEASFIGIEIHQMKRYTDFFDRYDIGVMRYPGMTEEQKDEIVMGFILNNLDVTYDYTRLAAFFLSPIVRRVSLRLWAKLFKKMTHRQRFVCTTFVHKAFHEMTEHRKGRGYVETRDEEANRMEEEELISPGDIAAEPIFDWVFNRHA